MSPIVETESYKSFGGYQKFYSHESKELGCKMTFAIYLPPQVEKENHKVPAIYYLSGLTCTELNFVQKAGAQRYASEHGVIVIAPDTSPRNCNVPGEDGRWNVGTGAGYYIDATQEPWKTNYRMYSYFMKEFFPMIENNFPILEDKQSIMGHSMGGHGALLFALRNPGMFKTVSTFAGVCDATKCPPFIEGFTEYLGGEPDDGTWDEWVPTKLVSKYNGPPLDILMDQGTDDMFVDILKHREFVEDCVNAHVPVTLNLREGYGHDYYFISSFMEQHFKHHIRYLK